MFIVYSIYILFDIELFVDNNDCIMDNNYIFVSIIWDWSR